MNVPQLRFKGFYNELKEMKLKEISEVVSGKRLPKGHTFKPKGIPYISVSDMGEINVGKETLSFISSETESLIKKYKVNNNDIIISIAGTLGKVNLIDQSLENANLTENCNKITVKESADYRYIFYYLKSQIIQRKIKESSTTSSQPKLALDRLRNFSIMLPTVEEQREIASFLELVNLKIEKQREKIEKLEQFKKGMMQKIFSQELRFKDEDNEEFPEWEEKKLNELGEFKKSYAFSRSYEGIGEYVHIHYGDIHTKLNSLIDNETELPSINVEGVLEELEVGDVLFADASEDYEDLGKAVVILEKENKKMIAGLHTHRFQPLSLINPVFLMYYTKTDYYLAFIRMYGTGVSVLGISKSNLGALEVPVPSIKEQTEIAKFLMNVERKIKKEKEKLFVLAEQKSGLMSRVFI